MNNKNKGDYGYLSGYKKGKLAGSVVLALMIIFDVVATVIMFGDTKRVAIIFAILLALPFAKLFIAFILSVKYRPLDKDSAQKLEKAAGGSEYILFDMVVSRYEGMKHYAAVTVKNGRIYALVLEKDYASKDKGLPAEYEKWLDEAANDSKYSYKISTYSDIGQYEKKIAVISTPNDNTRLVDRHIMDRIKDSSL
jgi:hypothetical protein